MCILKGWLNCVFYSHLNDLVCVFLSYLLHTFAHLDVMVQERKRQIVASAFGETDAGEKGSRLTTEDLRYLFRI